VIKFHLLVVGSQSMRIYYCSVFNLQSSHGPAWCTVTLVVVCASVCLDAQRLLDLLAVFGKLVAVQYLLKVLRIGCASIQRNCCHALRLAVVLYLNQLNDLNLLSTDDIRSPLATSSCSLVVLPYSREEKLIGSDIDQTQAILIVSHAGQLLLEILHFLVGDVAFLSTASCVRDYHR
jgi:hypothetical protein